MKVKLLVMQGALCFTLLLCPRLNEKLLAQSDSASVKKTITGKITDADGKPVEGATIEVKGTSTMVVAKPGGVFTLNNIASDAVLAITAVGFETQEILVGSQTAVSISLKTKLNALEDVVVVGYGTRKKSDVTGAVASIGAEDIKKRPVANVLQAMQGKIAGVDITSNERPGEIGSVLIRGSRSLSATNSPLYVVDGIPLPPSSGGMESLNPNDIESVDVLKDASATAIYGSRGANGVILITTKQGKKGKMTLSYIGTMTVENQHDRMQMMNSPEYIEFRRAAYRRAGNYPETPTQADDERIFGGDYYALQNIRKGWVNGTWNGNLVPTTDWTSAVQQTGITQDHTLSVSGGSDKMKTYASFGYMKQDGTIKGQDFKRYTGKYTTEVKPTKWFTMGGSVTGTYSIQNYGFQAPGSTGANNIYFAAKGMLPYAVPFDSTGKRINLPGGDINILNPILENQYSINERKVFRALGNFYGEIEFMKGLKYRMNFGPDYYNNRNGQWQDAQAVNRGAGEKGSTNQAILNNTTRFSWTLDNLVYYDKTFAGLHNLGVTLLQNATSNRTETSSMTASNLPWVSQKWYQLGSVSALDKFSTGLVEQELTSYMARVNYGFDNKYLFTASARWDGASQLAEGHKWDFFPSLALGWRMDQEDFIRNLKWINQLKLRVGYGVTGNAAVDPYQTKGGVQALYYTFGKTVASGFVSSDASLQTPIPMANLGLGWERTQQYNLGIDFDIYRGRLSGSIDVYTSKTKDLLLLMNIPTLTGYSTTYANVGATSNKGIDITLNSVNLKLKDFTWSTNLSVSATKNKIVSLNNGIQKDYVNTWFVGERSGIYYDYVKTGIWQNTQEDQAELAKFKAKTPGLTTKAGDIKVADLNHDYIIDANNDRKVVGHSAPNWTAGMNNNFSYKNFDLSIFIFSRLGYTILTGQEFLQGRFAQRQLNYWTPNNPTNDYPSPNYNSASGDTYKSSMNYQDGSFVKIRNISLGYTLPKSMYSKLTMSSCRVYAQMTNPGLIYSKVGWVDPDLGGATFNRGFVVGVNVGL